MTCNRSESVSVVVWAQRFFSFPLVIVPSSKIYSKILRLVMVLDSELTKHKWNGKQYKKTLKKRQSNKIKKSEYIRLISDIFLIMYRSEYLVFGPVFICLNESHSEPANTRATPPAYFHSLKPLLFH